MWCRFSAFEPTTVGPFAQIMPSTQGIARAAFNDMLAFVQQRARPWPDSGVERACDDPLTLDRTGRLAARLSAGDALLDVAGEAVDVANATRALNTSRWHRLKWRKPVRTTEVALEAGNLLFELGGSRASLREHNLDRHWRNARTTRCMTRYAGNIRSSATICLTACCRRDGNAMSRKQILLNAFNMNCVGHIHHGMWTHPQDHSVEFNSLAYWLDLARLLERGLFDGLFIADILGVYDVSAGYRPDGARVHSAAGERSADADFRHGQRDAALALA